MAFTARHMNKLAGMVALAREQCESVAPDLRPIALGVVDGMMQSLADMLADDDPIFDRKGNRRFDRARFLKACGVED